jgi:hypothetical protein
MSRVPRLLFLLNLTLTPNLFGDGGIKSKSKIMIKRGTGRLVALLCLFALIACALTSRAATFHTLSTTGHSSNRMNLVFLSEGYTSSQTNLFLADCTNAFHSFFGGGAYTGEEPFVEYSNYFNACAIFTASTNSGSDHPQYAFTNNTYFNSTFDAVNDYVITIPPGATGQGLVDSLLDTHTPTNAFRYRLPVMLVNDTWHGGSGGAIAIVATGFDLQGIMVHESAHVLAGLGDEYEADPGGLDFSGLPSEPNTTTNTAFNLIPWKAWIDTNTTAIPTPNDPTNAPFVGLWEGAHYSTTNWYRPKQNCRMRSVTTGIPFCEVCREALVKTFSLKTRIIDAASPTNAALTLTSLAPALFSVTPLQPVTHALSVQWQTNSVNSVGATNTTFNFIPATNGVVSVRAIVRDLTDWVRNDPENLLSATNTWMVTVANQELWLESAQALAGDKFRFTVRGSGLTNFSIKASTNLVTWTSIATNALVAGQSSYTNTGLGNIPWRFYRAVSPPQ